jgi:predicted RND superfamily exporter protein
MNPFNILEYKLHLAESDAEELMKYNEQLTGKQSEIKEKIDKNDQEIRIAISQKDIVQKKLLANPTDIIAKEGLEESLNTIAANTDYANGLKPAYNELVKLTNFTDRAFRAANLQIKMSRKQLSKQRDLYETVTTASATITKAKRALAGDAGVNSDADEAIELLRKDIGKKIGNIQSGIKITSEIMNSKDLENAAKLQTTLKQLEGVDLHEVPYSSTIASNAEGQMQINATGENPYLNFLQ